MPRIPKTNNNRSISKRTNNDRTISPTTTIRTTGVIKVSESAVLKTKFGNAKLGKKGYYYISSWKEGNNGKALHRLIFEDFYQIELPSNIHVHHDDGNKTNNEIWNLIPMTASEHKILHNKGNKWGVGRIVSDEERELLSKLNTGPNNSMYGIKLGFEERKELSKLKNTSGFYRVALHKRKNPNHNPSWEYVYSENRKVKTISSINLIKLKDKVLAKGLEWEVIDLEKAKKTLIKYGYNLEEFLL